MFFTLLHLAILFVTGTLLKDTCAQDPPKTDAGSDNVGVRFNLAPSYGTLNSKSLQQLDESLKVMMGGILRLDLQKRFTWSSIWYALDKSPLLIRQLRYSTDKRDRIIFRSSGFFGQGSDKGEREHRVRTWFSNLIGNVDILEDTDIDFDKIVHMVAKINVKMWDNLLKKTTKTLTLMDRGIIRFPDISRPFFTLYHIKLMGRCVYYSVFISQTETCGVVGIFQKEVYYPHRNYIHSLRRDTIDQILAEVDDLFKDK